jgi:endoglucanase
MFLFLGFNNFLLVLIFVCARDVVATDQKKISFWNMPQKGANIFNRSVMRDDINAAKQYGITFIRLAPDKFATDERDFLIGNADEYTGLVKKDLNLLKEILDICLQEKMPVVITMLSLPGSRWKQNNDDQDDVRIWNAKDYQRQAAVFWQELALELKDHPAVVGYNILNEPHPERLYDSNSIHVQEVQQQEIQKMIYLFYDMVIRAIRTVDQDTPIILDSSAYADSNSFAFFKPHNDPNILYSFHMYEPYEYTNRLLNQGQFVYPGIIGGKYWNCNELKNYMQSVIEFQNLYAIPSCQILVGEFGGHRMSFGLDEYFRDLIGIFVEQSWHFAFYAFREDRWEGMDYELGDTELSVDYWNAIENGQNPQLKRDNTNSIFSVIKDALQCDKN